MPNTQSGARAPRKSGRGGVKALRGDLSEILFHPEFKSRLLAEFTLDQVARLALDLSDLEREASLESVLRGDMYEANRADMLRLIRPRARAAMRKEIARYGGMEVFFIGRLDASGAVAAVEALAWGNRHKTPAPVALAKPGEVLIHNHPSLVRLEPSDPDLAVSSEAAQRGVGSYIVDNALTSLRVVVKPWPADVVRELENAPISESGVAKTMAVAATHGLTLADVPEKMNVTEEEALWILIRRRSWESRSKALNRRSASGRAK